MGRAWNFWRNKHLESRREQSLLPKLLGLKEDFSSLLKMSVAMSPRPLQCTVVLSDLTDEWRANVLYFKQRKTVEGNRNIQSHTHAPSVLAVAPKIFWLLGVNKLLVKLTQVTLLNTNDPTKT